MLKKDESGTQNPIGETEKKKRGRKKGKGRELLELLE